MDKRPSLSKPIAILSARVPPEVYNILEKKARERGMNLSQLVRYILTSTALGLEGVNISNINQPIIVNINMVQNEVSPEINVTSNDPEITKEYVKSLQDDLRKAKEVIKKKNEEIKQLKRKLQLLTKLAKAGDIHNIRKILGVKVG